MDRTAQNRQVSSSGADAPELHDVIEVEIEHPHRVRVLATALDDRNGDAVINFAVIRRGVDRHFYTLVAAGRYQDGDLWNGPEGVKASPAEDGSGGTMTNPSTPELRLLTYLATPGDHAGPLRAAYPDAVSYSDAEQALKADLRLILAALEERGKALEEARAALEEESSWATIVDENGTDQFDALGDTWLAMVPIRRMFNAIASVFSKWADDALMDRFKDQLAALMHQAFVEGCIVGVRAAKSSALTALGETPDV